MKNRNLCICLSLLLLSFFLCGFSFFDEIKLGSYAQKKQQHEIIKMLQPTLDAGEHLSSWHLFFLAGAYYEIRDYNKALTTIELMQKQINLGDSTAYGADISVYPRIFRGLTYLDQGDIARSITEGKLAYKMLHEEGRGRRNFYKSELISICDFLGVALALDSKVEESQKIADTLVRLDIGSEITGPEKYTALARIYMALKDYPRALQAIKDPQSKVTGLVTAFYDQTFQEIPKLYILSKSLYETGNIKEAQEGYDQLLSHPQIEQVGGIYWIVLSDRAKIAKNQGQNKIAEEMFKKAIDVIERQRSSISTEAGRIGFVGDKQGAYAGLTALLVNKGRYAEAFAYVERAKARALVDLLASQKNIKIPNRQTEQIKTTLTDLSKAERDLTVVAQSANSNEQFHTRSVVLTLKKNCRKKRRNWLPLFP